MAPDADAGLTADEIRDLGRLAALMIPADAGLGMPAADDPAILADLVRTLGRDLPLVREAVATLAPRLAGLDLEASERLINEWTARGGAAAAALGRVVAAAYYRDDRVLQAIGHEPRAPFPKGYEVEAGDWTLLEPVRRRAPLWRDDRSGGRRA
jgi:hypothetical protein